MDVTGLAERTEGLVAHMRKEGYGKSYIRAIETDIRWLERNGSRYGSYREACDARMAETASDEMRRRYRLDFGIVRRYVEDGVLPDRRRKEPLYRHCAYEGLGESLAAVVDDSREGMRSQGLDESTVAGYSSALSCFLLAMQGLGRASLAEVRAADAMGHFVAPDGTPRLSCSAKKEVASALGYCAGEWSAEAARVASLLPCLKTSRKNVDYLRADEASAVASAISGGSGDLSLRDRAAVSLMFHTGLRASDVAGLRLSDIDWERDRIEVVQEKTGEPLVLPLTAAVGNPIFDYIETERPDSDDDHVFLGTNPPHDPLAAGALWHVAGKAYDAAGVRVGDGRRRGTHLFRHRAATTMVSAGVPRQVASAVLGHRDPGSLDHYLSADVEHLRTCALDVSRFPVAEGVFAR